LGGLSLFESENGHKRTGRICELLSIFMEEWSTTRLIAAYGLPVFDFNKTKEFSNK
jgi:hypothetical protein